MSVFRLPDLGEGLQDAEIVTWHVTEGDHVIADQPLVSVETDKAVVEVPAPYSGTVRKLLAQEGDVVAISAPLVEIETGASADTGAIVGDLQRAETDKEPETAHAEAVEATRPSGPEVKASPAVRRLAREKGIDLATLSGSGPDGAILTSDVIAAGDTQTAGEPLRGVRRSMARAMERAHIQVVPATTTDIADIHLWPPDEVPTKRFVQAIAVACRAVPALNAWYDNGRVQQHSHVNLALAVDTPDGLFAPVLRSVETEPDLAARIADLKHAVETRSLAPSDLREATFTLSNFGTMGGLFAALVVTPPQVAILGTGRISETWLADAGKPVLRKVLPLSLTFDHRAVTGGEALSFLNAVKQDLEAKTSALGG
jgi:pyruvate dehydrogenase E2 component (dihydrolipoamide acetyltransferase)